MTAITREPYKRLKFYSVFIPLYTIAVMILLAISPKGSLSVNQAFCLYGSHAATFVFAFIDLCIIQRHRE